GPWGHATNRGPRLGEIEFGPQAVIDLDTLQVRWFDRWLKGKANGVERDPPVRIFIMGENRWREEREWPLARTKYLKLYLRGGGRANSALGDGRLDTLPPAAEPPDRYRSDPNDPVPFITDASFSQMGGPDDYRPVERRDDVLVYTSAELTKPMEVCGPLRTVLYAASSARDADWITRVLDVHPGGFAQRLNEGVFRARYRKSLERAEPLAHEVVPPPAAEVHVGREAVVPVGDDQEIVVLVGPGQRVDQLDGHRRMHVVVQVPERQQQLPLEILGQRRVGLGAVVIAVRHPLVGLAPERQVAPLVVVPRRGDRHLVEVGIGEDGP